MGKDRENIPIFACHDSYRYHHSRTPGPGGVQGHQGRLSFIVIIVVVCLCVVLLSRLLEKVIKITTLGWINRLLGVLLSVSAVVLLIGVVISVIEYVNTTWFTIIPPEQMAKSKGVQIISSITDTVFPYLKQLFNT